MEWNWQKFPPCRADQVPWNPIPEPRLQSLHRGKNPLISSNPAYGCQHQIFHNCDFLRSYLAFLISADQTPDDRVWKRTQSCRAARASRTVLDPGIFNLYPRNHHDEVSFNNSGFDTDMFELNFNAILVHHHRHYHHRLPSLWEWTVPDEGYCTGSTAPGENRH